MQRLSGYEPIFEESGRICRIWAVGDSDNILSHIGKTNGCAIDLAKGSRSGGYHE